MTRVDKSRERAIEASDPWQEHNLSQLLYFRSLTLREKLEAVEGMGEIVHLLDRMRARERE